jgi:hypothetical protein
MQQHLLRFLLRITDANTYSPTARRLARAIGVQDWYCSYCPDYALYWPRLSLGRKGFAADFGRYDFSIDFGRQVLDPWREA